MKLGQRGWLAAGILLAWLPSIAGISYAAVYQWSTTAGSNDAADPSINWREGMAPSAVNDSARAMMAALAGWRDDTSGALTTSGTSTAFTITTNQVLPSTPNDGQLLAITMHATNGVAPTLQADGGTVYPIQSAPGVAVPSGTLILGSSYTLRFSNANASWILRDFFNSPFIVPVGTMLPFTGSSVPNSSFVFPSGQCISRTVYATYFAIVGTTYGGCDGSTTFAVPDMRGRMWAGLDNMNGSNAGRLSASCSSTSIGAVCGSPTQSLNTNNLPPYTPSGSVASGPITVTALVGSSPALGGATFTASFAGGGVGGLTSIGNLNISASQSGSSFSGSPQGGSSAAFNTVPPMMIGNIILRII